jgi:hypothetical protein
MSGVIQLSGGTIGKSKLVSIAVALALAAFGVTWLVHSAGNARLALQQHRNAEMAAESRALCQKWGMFAGTETFDECLVDIQTVREHQAKRDMEDVEPF